MGGLPITLLSMGCHFYALAAESDPVARKACTSAMPNIVHVEDVKHVFAKDLVAFIKRRQPRAILLGGGSPCQGNSSLNLSRRGLRDERSLQPLELCRIRDELVALPECAGIPILTFLENVKSMPASVLAQYVTWMGFPPVHIDAIDCGWVHRSRLYWLGSQSAHVGPHLPAPPDWVWDSKDQDGQVPRLKYQGKKPVPARVCWDAQFQPLHNPADVLKGNHDLGFHPFTREFRHPTDRVHRVSAQAADRFFQDSCRFPPSAYEEGSLLWRGEEWRVPTPAERCQVMGLPPAAVSQVEGPQAVRTQVRNSLIGNGFHLPSVLALMCFLPLLMANKIPYPVVDYTEASLKQRLESTVWEPGRIDTFPGLMDAGSVILTTQQCFPQLTIDPKVWTCVETRLQQCQLARLQYYVAWSRLQGREWELLGPVPVAGKDRTAIYAGLSGQRYPSGSGRGLDHLLPPGLGPEQHMTEAAALPSPFRPRPWPEPDVAYVVEAICVWQQILPAFASELRNIVKTVAKAVQPLELALDGHRCFASNHVAAAKRPAFLAIMSVLLRWPDLTQAQDLVHGYRIVGEFATSGVFRAVSPAEAPPVTEWLGAPAEEAVDKIIRSAPPRYHEEIFQVTQEEQARNFCGPFQTRKELDDQFGVGQWRPLERFLIKQPDGKLRVIDNARKTGHNRQTTLFETITTVNIDCIATFAQMMCDGLGLTTPPCDSFPWLDLRIGTDDLPDAYRGLPVSDDHQRFSVVAIYIPSTGWRFSQLYGLAYGLESAVVNFNRFPQVGIAMARRMCLALTAAYFDDELAVEFIANADVSQKGLRVCFTAMGATPQASKAFQPAANRHYLGTSIHTGEFLCEGLLRFQPKSGTSHKVCAHLEVALANQSLDRDTAGKLRGDLNWMFSNCSGHVGRFAGPTLSALQQRSDPALTPAEEDTLRVLRSIVANAQPRDISICGATPQPIRIYSDASFEDGVLRLGWIIFPLRGRPFGGTCAVPTAVLDAWTPRKQQIFPGESLCGLLVPWLHGPALRHHDLLWFIDNEAAVSSLIRGASSQEDVHLIAQFSHAFLHTLQCRVWYEWTDSASNPSDGLSRDGLLDVWSLNQLWDLREYSFPTELLPDSFLASFLEHLNLTDSG